MLQQLETLMNTVAACLAAAEELAGKSTALTDSHGCWGQLYNSRATLPRGTPEGLWKREQQIKGKEANTETNSSWSLQCLKGI